ncbi:MAG: 1-acyl-sn-glycerol-3-phosphate acyltransferase, partial [Crocinitomicaceae bacterium]|nr:1-acyl-sn-glycerol-3-phosphate acyltransferase [Crocinitomicaceae bacterium]
MLRVFYRRIRIVNTQKTFYAQTIFVCNHPSAFIDPLIIANFHKPIIHFMTRSDVFKPWLKPVTWACHMVPIYRMAEDGNDSAEKNIATFKE